ncbi:hypothetical protein PPYR_12027 [Photinus pyralis]|uniref:HECT-type E3 ubiquitin transferase n=1 Tax=Photinus pyralis TaxID=7054 RepID=A0A5N4AD58_PHOPY|nr:hypothetical protein PPYR_12027 [Photinus pyralis]
MEDFLRSRGIPEEKISRMLEEKITPDVVLLMNDTKLAEFVPKYGDRIALMQYCKAQLDSTRLMTDKKESLLESLRQKLKGGGNSSPKRCKGHPQDVKQIEVGWLCHMNLDGKYKQVREKGGGGTRKMKVPKEANKDFILTKALDLFFPNGHSSKGDLSKFDINLFDFQNHEVDKDSTVAELLEKTGLSKLRFYLATRETVVETVEDVVEILEPDHPTINEPVDTNKGTLDTIVEYTLQQFPDENHSNEDVSLVQLDNEEIRMESVDVTHSLNFEFNELVDSIIHEYNDPPINEELTPVSTKGCEPYCTAVDILLDLQRKICYDKINKFNIFRSDIFVCCVRAMRRKTFNPFFKTSVKFSDIEGTTEGAIDEGGPAREMFRLVLLYLQDSQLFVGEKKKYISLNNNSLNQNYYFEAGRIIALALVHGGPAPHFFSESLYSLIAYGIEETTPTIEDVESDIKDLLVRLEQTTNILDLQELIASDNAFSIAGCHYVTNLDEKCRIGEDMLKFYAIKRVEEPIKQFIEGLKTCDIYNQIREYPRLFKDMFCKDQMILTGETLENIFQIEYSDIGSTQRDLENRAMSYFRDYIGDCEETLLEDDADENEGQAITLADILIFATGADCVPPLGFPIVPKIMFLHGENSGKYPLANTCALNLKIPTIHKRYDDFKANLDFAFGNCKSFGFA